MRPTRSLAPLALAALGGLAIGACGLADVFRSAGLKNVVVTYCGDTLLAVGTREAVVVTVEANGAIIPNPRLRDRKSTRLNSSHGYISYAVFCLKKKKKKKYTSHV